jgi:hypothetical protein
MVQRVWDANKYAPGTNLSDLGWFGATWTVVEFSPGRHYWRSWDSLEQFTPLCSYDQALQGPYEILLLSDFTANELGKAKHGVAGAVRTGRGGNTIADRFEVCVTVAGNVNTTNKRTSYLTYTTDNNITTLTGDSAIGIRLQLDANNLGVRYKSWGSAVGGLEAAEPVSYNHIGSYEFPTYQSSPHYMGVQGVGAMTEDNIVSVISIGTGGQPALYSNPTQPVVLPSGLTATPTHNSATLDWV